MPKALILVGGQGTRLRPLTCNTPKPMVPVINVPFLEHVIRNLRQHGVAEIVLAQHHLPRPMADYFGDGRRFGVSLTYVMEDTPRGTAGAVKNAERYLDCTFFVLNGDIFHDRDFTAILDFHQRNQAKATIVLTPVEDPSAYGVVETDAAGKVRAFIEKPKREEATSNMINAGTYVLEPDVLHRVPEGVKHSFERELFPGLLQDNQPVYAYSCRNYWMDTGTPEKYLQLHRDLLDGKCEGYVVHRDVEVGAGCRIHPSVKMSGKVVIADGCVIEEGVEIDGPVVLGAHCRVGKGAHVSDSVLWERVTVGAWARMQVSALANDCVIGEGARLSDAVLGDHVTVDAGMVVPPGARIHPPGEEPHAT